MFSNNNTVLYRVALAVVVLGTAAYFNSIRSSFDTREQDEYKIIRKYLLNDSPLYGYNKPKIWIHTKYEVNARVWRDFYSRNTTDLNQPYIHLTIKTIIDHCGDDFHICLIDDASFEKLIPGWRYDLLSMPDPIKSQMRQYGLAKLLYCYGGLIVPNTFICMKSLLPLYEEGTSENGKVFCMENLNQHVNTYSPAKNQQYIADPFFMGSKKNDETIQAYCEFLKGRNPGGHFSNEFDLKGDVQHWMMDRVFEGRVLLMDGNCIGIKDMKRRPILLENLMEEQYLELNPNIYGVYIPGDEVLKRTKYEWLAAMNSEQLLETNMVVTKYLKNALIDASGLYAKNGEIKSAISI